MHLSWKKNLLPEKRNSVSIFWEVFFSLASVSLFKLGAAKIIVYLGKQSSRPEIFSLLAESRKGSNPLVARLIYGHIWEFSFDSLLKEKFRFWQVPELQFDYKYRKEYILRSDEAETAVSRKRKTNIDSQLLTKKTYPVTADVFFLFVFEGI